MSRDDTFGYDASVSVGGIVLGHIVQGLFHQGHIPDAIELPEVAHGAAVRLGLVTARPVRPTTGDIGVEIRMDIAQVVNVPGVPEGARGWASVRLSYRHRGDGRVEPQLDRLAAADVRFDPVAEALLAEEAAAAREAVASAVRRLDPTLLSFELNLSDPAMDVDAADAAVDAGAVVLGLFRSDAGAGEGNPTRGSRGDLRSLIESGESFVYRLSAAAFNALVAKYIAKEWGRVDLSVPETGEVSEGGIFVRAPNPAGTVRVWSDAGAHDNVRLAIRNHRTGQALSRTTDAVGAFSAELVNCHPGDQIEIRGQFVLIKDRDMLVRPPRIALSDGLIRVAGQATVTDPLEMDIEYQVDVALEPDLSTSVGVSARAVNTELDIPWWADLLAWIVPFGFLVVMFARDAAAAAVSGIFRDAIPDPSGRVTGLGMAPFFDSISVTPRSIEFAGQLHAGTVIGSGRIQGDTVPRLLTVAQDGRRRGLWGAVVADMPRAGFHEVGETRLASVTATGSSLPPPSGGVRDGLVTAVVGDGSLAKVEVQRAAPSPPVLRWVRYGPPLRPSVRLDGRVGPNGALGPFRRFGDEPYPVWSADLRVVPNLQRLLLNDDLDIEWSVIGPGSDAIMITTRTHPGDQIRWRLRAADLGIERPTEGAYWDTPLPGGERVLREVHSPTRERFEVTFQVTVTDVFGRTARSRYTLIGVIGYPHEWEGLDPGMFERADLGPGAFRDTLPDWAHSRMWRSFVDGIPIPDILRSLRDPFDR